MFWLLVSFGNGDMLEYWNIEHGLLPARFVEQVHLHEQEALLLVSDS